MPDDRLRVSLNDCVRAMGALNAIAQADTFAGLSGIFVPTTSYEQIMAERNAS